jgi:hypothetical protein
MFGLIESGEPPRSLMGSPNKEGLQAIEVVFDPLHDGVTKGFD